MKLFQQLLLAPAALGLLAPLAANAAEVNINDVSSYAKKPAKQSSAVRNVQFSDVVPGDWAYTALQNLSESYGCVGNVYTNTIESGQALTRYEAAALLNACLEGNIASIESNSDASRLIREFGTEMAILKGRVDGIEHQDNTFKAGQFSTSTKVSGKVVFNTGAMDMDVHNNDAQMGDKLSSSYVAQYNVNTSFTGEDRLYTRIKAGNMGTTPWEDTAHGTHLAAAHASDNNQLEVDKLWYEFPIGEFKVWAGPRIENYYMLASSPSIYKPVMKQFALGGNAATYGSSTDGGFGLAWIQPTENRSDGRFAFSTNFASKGASNANSGIFTNEPDQKWLSKVEYGTPRMQVSLAMAQHQCAADAAGACRDWADYYTTTAGSNVTGDSTAYAFRAYWMPEETGALPSVQFGFDTVNVDDNNVNGSTERASGFMVGLTWKDAFADGNRLATAFGSPQKATEIHGGGDDAADPFTFEVYYDYKVSDGVTITPAIFASRDRISGANDASDDFWGALVQTTFKF